MKKATVSSPEDQSVSIWRNPFVVIGSALLLFFGSQVVGTILASSIVSGMHNKTYQLAIIVACNVIIGFGIMSLLKDKINFKWRDIGWKKPKTEGFLVVIPAFILYFIISLIITSLVAALVHSFNAKEAQDVGFSGLHTIGELGAGFIALGVLTPIFEETVFRGILFKGLRRRFPFWASALITSIIFAAAHLQWNVSLDVFALSLILCCLVERYQSIVPGILLHGLKNGLAFILLFVIK